MKEHKNLRFKVLFMISTLLVFTLALALIGNAAPHTPALITTTWKIGEFINISTKTTNDGSLINISHFSLFFSASNTANSTSRLVLNITNTTATNFDLGYANITLGNDIILEDTAIGTVTSIATGAGDSANTNITSTTVIVDRTICSVPTSISPTGKNTTDKDYTFSATVIGVNTTQGTLDFVNINPGQKSYTMTHTGNTLSVTINDIAEGSYPYTVTCSDGTNSSTSAEQLFSVDLPSSSNRKAKIFNIFGGGGGTKADVARGLAIAQSTRAGEVSLGLAKAQVQINQFVQKETQKPELIKSGIGLGAGIAVGFLVPTLLIPGVGFITAPIIGGLIGAGIGVAT